MNELQNKNKEDLQRVKNYLDHQKTGSCGEQDHLYSERRWYFKEDSVNKSFH